MESHEVLRQAVERVGAKRVARDLHVSTSLVYKWCEARREEPDGSESGARNPLDRLAALMESTGPGAHELIDWLCERAGGFFVANPAFDARLVDTEFISHTQRMIHDFSDLLRVVSESMANDGSIDEEEARRIRAEWQRLKGFGECFVSACETGLFRRPDEEDGAAPTRKETPNARP